MVFGSYKHPGELPLCSYFKIVILHALSFSSKVLAFIYLDLLFIFLTQYMHTRVGIKL